MCTFMKYCLDDEVELNKMNDIGNVKCKGANKCAEYFRFRLSERKGQSGVSGANGHAALNASYRIHCNRVNCFY
jgi:hypothetical protein